MVRAIMRLALLEAIRHGQYHASFHGFRVYALRESSAAGCGASQVSFLVSHPAMPLERGVAVMYASQRLCRRASRNNALSPTPESGTNPSCVGPVD